jgi:hypothetical protein
MFPETTFRHTTYMYGRLGLNNFEICVISHYLDASFCYSYLDFGNMVLVNH